MKISRKIVLKSFIGGIAFPASIKKEKQKDLISFRKEFIEAWKKSEEQTLANFNQMPEDKFDFKYTPDSFSFRTQFVHCIVFTTAQLCGRLGIANPYDKKPKDFWKNISKADLEKELQAFYEWVIRVVNEINDEKLLQTENYSGGSIPIWQLFYAMENHIIHHRGQAICYLRLNGIIPVGYIGW